MAKKFYDGMSISDMEITIVFSKLMALVINLTDIGAEKLRKVDRQE